MQQLNGFFKKYIDLKKKKFFVKQLIYFSKTKLLDNVVLSNGLDLNIEFILPSYLFNPSGVLIQKKLFLSKKIEFTFSEEMFSISNF